MGGAAAAIMLAAATAAPGAIPEPPPSNPQPPPPHEYTITAYEDPCPARNYDTTTATGRKHRTECWIRYAFPPNEWAAATATAGLESGYTWHPWIRNYRQYIEDEGYDHQRKQGQYRYVPAAARKGNRVYGLFQHRWSFWPGRARQAAAYYGEPQAAADYDPFEGWHNVLVAAWLAGRQGWGHWHYCDSSRITPRPKKTIDCGPGRWITPGEQHRFAATQNPKPPPQPVPTLYIRFKDNHEPPKPGVEAPPKPAKNKQPPPERNYETITAAAARRPPE